ncbi:MAG: LamG-like jellyroll fold domain-containing protein [Terrimicrobiaceae bacterium]|nr:LamG-like jellyroll fold domain-containing protein [Terrimicrobiaceae bacterium]
MKTKSPLKIITASALTLAFGILTSHASTIAYWRFEDQPDGGTLTGTMGGAPFTTTADSSGNGNSLRTFNGPSAPNTSATFVSLVPDSVVPQTGAPNVRSAEFNGINQDIYVDIGVGNLRTFNFTGDFTIEASFRSTGTGWRTFLGRDGENPGGGRLFYQQRGDNGNLQFAFLDASNTFRAIDSGINVANTSTWFNTAVVSSGSTVTLYIQDSLDDSWDVVGTTATSGGLFNVDATWAVGRGWFNGPNDFWAGQVDEIRISDSALSPSQFLQSVPEPSTVALAVVGVACLALRRKRRSTAQSGNP